MTIRHLTVFVAVAEQGSMSAAAKHLYLSQPTVSQAIRELEAHYNGLLFERLGKKLYLTERGKLLLPHAREMIRQFQQLEELMQNQGQSSTLKLGSTLTVGTCLTPSIILDLQKKIPDLDVYSFVTNTQNIEQKLLRSELDAAVVEGEIHSPDLDRSSHYRRLSGPRRRKKASVLPQRTHPCPGTEQPEICSPGIWKRYQTAF